MSDELPTAARIADPGIRALYRQENRWQAWLDVEVALARAQAELKIIPQEAADAIARAARLDRLDRKRIDKGFARTGHTIVPLVWELARVVGEPHGGWVHWGATTQNITQTGDLLVLRQAHHIFLKLIADALLAAADLAERGADMPIPGRTHGRHVRLARATGAGGAGRHGPASRHAADDDPVARARRSSRREHLSARHAGRDLRQDRP
jgi:3-carboxy-cis,cis-muconate cycloisomerase